MSRKESIIWLSKIATLTVIISMLLVSSVFAAERYYFPIPEEAYWGGGQSGIAHWKKVEKAKEYEVVLYCGDTRVKRVYAKGTKTDLSEFMENDQVYTFAVRAVPVDSQKNYRAGDWLFSEELIVDWLGTTGGRWRNYTMGKKYQREDQTYCANGWEMIHGDWYYFNADGFAQTGWIQVEDKQYYLDEEGKMQTEWLWWGDAWYYLDRNGVMQTGWIQSEPGQWYYLGSDGKMLADTIVEGYHLDATGRMIN